MPKDSNIYYDSKLVTISFGWSEGVNSFSLGILYINGREAGGKSLGCYNSNSFLQVCPSGNGCKDLFAIPIQIFSIHY